MATTLKTYMKKAVEYYTKHPKRIEEDWFRPHEARYGRIFAMLSPSGEGCHEKRVLYGCPVQIRFNPQAYSCLDPTLGAQIIADERIPNCVDLLTPEHLPILAEIQLAAQAIRDKDKPGRGRPTTKTTTKKKK